MSDVIGVTHPVYVRYSEPAPSGNGITLICFPTSQAETFEAMRHYICHHMEEVEEPKGLAWSYYYGYVPILGEMIVGVKYV